MGKKITKDPVQIIKERYKECCQAVVDDSEWNVRFKNGCNGVNSSEAYVVMRMIYLDIVGEEPLDAWKLCEESQDN